MSVFLRLVSLEQTNYVTLVLRRCKLHLWNYTHGTWVTSVPPPPPTLVVFSLVSLSLSLDSYCGFLIPLDCKSSVFPPVLTCTLLWCSHWGVSCFFLSKRFQCLPRTFLSKIPSTSQPLCQHSSTPQTSSLLLLLFRYKTLHVVTFFLL